jgi:hypothetical protein
MSAKSKSLEVSGRTSSGEEVEVELVPVVEEVVMDEAEGVAVEEECVEFMVTVLCRPRFYFMSQQIKHCKAIKSMPAP